MSHNTFSLLQNALRRSTSVHTVWLREVDGLRFMAILAVVLQHLLERFTRHTTLDLRQPVLDDPFAFFISRGTVGVFLFFAISGFVLALPFARHHLEGATKPGLRAYFLRRVTRLEPPYLIWMGVFAGVLLVKGAFSFPDLFPHLLASLTYTHGAIFGDHSPINPVVWSLEVEIQFYLMAPFLAALFFSIPDKTKRRMALLGTVLGWMLLQSQLGWWLFSYKLSLLGHLPHFLVGFLVADFYLTDWKKAPRQHVAWDVAAVLAYVTMCYTWTTELWKNLLFAAALFVLFAAAFRGVYFKKMLQNGWIAVAGGMCYTIYLIHLPLLEGLTLLTKNIVWTEKLWVNFGLQVAICLPIVWVLGALFFWMLEKPFMRMSLPTWSTIRGGMQAQKIRLLGRLGIWSGLMLLSFSLKAQEPVPQTPVFQAVAPPRLPDSLRLRPISELIESALLNAPQLSANRTDVAKQTLVADVQRKSWTDMLTMNGTAYYGNGTVNEIRSIDGFDADYATGRLGKGINLTLGVKINGSDFATRRQKTKIQVLQLDRLQSEREMLENQIRDAVMAQYFPLENVLQTVRLRAGALETMKMARAVAEKYFKEGNLPISEFTNLLMQETKAQEEFFKAQSEAKQRAVQLENLVKAGIWAK